MVTSTQRPKIVLEYSFALIKFIDLIAKAAITFIIATAPKGVGLNVLIPFSRLA